ncbi:MAG: GNAT family N-acetyltransferase, partial [Clostridia bacterium]|nr:GNAT family N-acetyltransferase [Clostridia bacterium]
LRKIQEADKDKFIELAIENAVNPKLFQVEEYREGLWKDHNSNTTVVFTIEKDGQYAGYCSVNDVTKNNWEISIELLQKFHRQGIGYSAISMMLDIIKEKFGVSEFRVRMFSDNIGSRKLFEKLGAEPNGISEYMIHNKKDIYDFEEQYLHTITDDLREVAKRFNVEPRQLLSHVLEYRLVWK